MAIPAIRAVVPVTPGGYGSVLAELAEHAVGDVAPERAHRYPALACPGDGPSGVHRPCSNTRRSTLSDRSLPDPETATMTPSRMWL
jgi:hypothetical protein